MLDEGDDAWGVLDLFRVSVASLGRVAKKGGVPHVVGFLPMPISGVPLEVSNETRFENPEDEGFLTWRREVSGYPKRCTVALMGKHTDRLVARQGDGGVLGDGWLDAASWGGSSVFPGAGCGLEGFDDLVDPVQCGGYGCFSFADLVSHQGSVFGRSWVPGDAVDNEIFVLAVEGVEA
ncbi:unnamed protein product [Sphagnum tenellum]